MTRTARLARWLCALAVTLVLGVPAWALAFEDQAAVQARLDKGGLVTLPAGELLLTRPLVLPARTTLRGAGKGVTVLRVVPGANVNALETADFAQLKGTSRLADAPSDITVEALSIDGGFLSGSWSDAHSRVLNDRGSCLVLYGRRLHIDVEANNCAQHMLYSEGQGPRQSEEVASQFRLSGLVAGEECVVFRGAGDSRVESLSAGVCGAKRLKPRGSPTCSSVVQETCAGFDALVVQRSLGYEGTLEIGYAHVFAAFSGWGLRTIGNPRLHASHLVSESNRGGVLIERDTWGAIDLLDVHSNGKTLQGGSLQPWPGLEVRSQHGFSVGRGLIARTAGSGTGFTAAVLAGRGGQFSLAIMNTRNPAEGEDFAGDGVQLLGSANVLTLTAWRARGAALRLEGTDNVVTFTGEGEVLQRDAGRNVLIRPAAADRLKDGP